MGQHEPVYLAIGKVLGPWGVKGELKVEILTEFPDRFALLDRVYLGEKLTPWEVEGFRLYRGKALLKLKGCHDRTTAQALRGQLVQIPAAEAMPLSEGQYYVHQILGLEVLTTAGEGLGQVKDIIFTGSNEVYVVQDQGREILIPALEDVVLEVDLAAGRLIVELVDGLL